MAKPHNKPCDGIHLENRRVVDVEAPGVALGRGDEEIWAELVKTRSLQKWKSSSVAYAPQGGNRSKLN